MQSWILEEQIDLINMGENLAYLLKNNENFYDFEYKIIQEHKENFIKCCKATYNGRTQIVYFNNELISLDKLIEKKDMYSICIAFKEFAKAIHNIENNGFLNIVHIDNRLDKVFFDCESLKIKFIYVPINTRFQSKRGFDFVMDFFAENSMKIQGLESLFTELNTEAISLTDVVSIIDKYIEKLNPHGNQHRVNDNMKFCIVSRNESINIPITKKEFVIGKSLENADGVLTGNSAISRIHCKFIIQGERLMLIDLNSSNGTFVNGRRISPSEPTEVFEGNNIKLANMEFIIRREK